MRGQRLGTVTKRGGERRVETLRRPPERDARGDVQAKSWWGGKEGLVIQSFSVEGDLVEWEMMKRKKAWVCGGKVRMLWLSD